MNIREWQEQVWDCPNMNTTAVAICLAIGSHGNWNESQTVWPSRQRISGMVNLSRESVGKYMTALEEQGWLKVVGLRKDNVREYELTRPQVVECVGILAKSSRGRKDGFKNQVVESSGEVVESVDKQVVESVEQVVESLDTNLPRTYKKNLQEELTNTVPDADAPVPVPSNLEVKGSLNKHEMLTSYLNWKRYTTASNEYQEAIKGKTLDPRWKPHETRPNHRLTLAAEELNERRATGEVQD